METHERQRLFRIPHGERISLRDMLIAWWPALLVVAAGFAFAWHYVEPAPPKKVTIATGTEDGAYYRYAARYGEILARNGITLELRKTSGSVENFDLLLEPHSGIDIAFVQGGVGDGERAPGLVSLGSMYYEPIWVFCRAGESLNLFTQLKGRRFAIGPEGSGTRRLSLTLLHANGLPIPNAAESALTGNAAANALLDKRVDIVILVAAAEADAIKTLLRDPRVRLLSFDRTEAYSRQFPYLSSVVLPRGVVDLKSDQPREDVHLIATTANLIVRDTLHPAIVGLLAAAAKEVHSAPGMLQRKDYFPSLMDVDFPASPVAARFYRSGPPFLQRYLPFWAAIFVDRMMVLLVPLIALALPLARALPALYDWRVRSRVYRHYGELRFLEDEIIGDPLPEKMAKYGERLDRIDERVNRLHIPLAYHSQLYMLRQHIELVRGRLAKITAARAA